MARTFLFYALVFLAVFSLNLEASIDSPAPRGPFITLSDAPASSSSEAPAPASASSEAPAPASASSEAPAPASASSEAPAPASASSEAPAPASSSSEAPPAPSVKTPSPAPAPATPRGVSSSRGMSGGKKAGIAIGVIAAAGLITGACFVMKKRRSNERRASYGNATRRAML